MECFQSIPKPSDPPAEALAEERRAERKKKSENVIERGLAPGLAFQKFAGSFYCTQDSDFSESVVKKQNIVSVSSKRREFVSLQPDKRAFESPLDRFARLKAEVDAFAHDMQGMAKEAELSRPRDPSKADVTSLLADEVNSLELQLAGVLQDPRTRPLLENDYTPSKAALQHGLTANAVSQLLQELKKPAQESSADGSAAAAAASYELYMTPAAAAAAGRVPFADMDRRLAKLEKIIGQSEDLAAYPDIQTGLGTLQRKMELMDTGKLDTAYRRIKSLLTELEALEQQKKQVTGKKHSAHEEKVNRLYAIMSRWDASAQQLPAVVARLQSLKEMHEASADATLRLQAVERQAEGTQELLAQDKQVLAEATKSLESNMTTLQSNLAHLESRFQTLEGKMAQL